MDFSFIIPAYNAEKTLAGTVESILNTVSECEIIIIENGSNDNTRQVLESYKDNHKIICTESEKGVSAARNKGLELASGKWIIFVDADDKWIGTMQTLQKTVNLYNNADIIVGSYYKDDDLIIHDYKTIEKAICGRELMELFGWMLEKPTLRTEVWAKIFKREYLINNQIFFDRTLTHSEDAEFMIRALEKCQCAVVTKESIYKFSSGTPSTMRTIDNKKTRAYIKALKLIDKHEILHKEELKKAYRDFIISHLYLIEVHEVYNCNMKDSFLRRRKKTIRIVNTDVFSAAVSQLTFKDLKKASLLPGFLLKKKMYTAAGMIFYYRSLQNSKRYKKYAGSADWK